MDIDSRNTDTQGWISVTNRRRSSKRGEESEEEAPVPKHRIHYESLQGLIRKRIQMKVNQERADILCFFPRHTFKNIESNRYIPTDQQCQRIQHIFGILLRIESSS